MRSMSSGLADVFADLRPLSEVMGVEPIHRPLRQLPTLQLSYTWKMGNPFSRGFPISCNQKMTQPELPSSLYLLGQSEDAATVKRLHSDHDFIPMKPVMTTSSQSLDVFSSTTISIYHAVQDSATSKSEKPEKMTENVEMATKKDLEIIHTIGVSRRMKVTSGRGS